MLELYQVLIHNYAVPPPDAVAEVERFTRAPLSWLPLDADQGKAALDARH
jgi:hypothetical protein